MPKFFTTSAGPGSGYNPSWRQRGLGMAAAFQGRDYQDPELAAYLDEQRQKKFFAERLAAEEKGKDLAEERAIGHLAQIEMEKPQLQRAMPGVVLSTLSPADREYSARQRVRPMFARSQVAPLLRSVAETEKMQGIIPKVAEVAKAVQGQELASAKTGTTIAENAGVAERSKTPFMSTLGETEVTGNIAQNRAKAGEALTSIEEQTEARNLGLPRLRAQGEEARLNAGMLASDVAKATDAERLNRDVPRLTAEKEAAATELDTLTSQYDLEDLLVNREGQQKLIEATIKSKRLDAEAQAMLSELKLSAMAGGLSPKEQKELRAIVLGITRPLSQSMKLEDFGMGGSVRTPEEEEYLSTLAGLVARIQAKKAANNATIK